MRTTMTMPMTIETQAARADLRNRLVTALLLAASLVGGCGAPTETANPSADAPPEAGVLLVSGGTVLTLDAGDTVIENGAVATSGSRIVAIGDAGELAARFPGARTLRAEGAVVMPGLINSHTHVPMTLFRGLADDLELMEWLEDHIFPAEAEHVDEDFVRWGTRLACLEMIRGGITTFVDMYYFEHAIAEETAACGLRAIVGESLIDFPAPDNKTWDEAVAYARRFVEDWRGHELITPAIAPPRRLHRLRRAPDRVPPSGHGARRAAFDPPRRSDRGGREEPRDLR